MTDVFLEPWRFPANFHSDEDISSLVVRMAAKGGMTVQQFVRLYLLGVGRDASDVVFDNAMAKRLATIAGVEQSILLSNSLSDGREKYRSKLAPSPCFRGLKLSPSTIHTRKRVAPGMLASDGVTPYMRLAWRFQILPGDPNTGEALIHRCPSCLKDLLWRSPNLCLCGHCGFDIRAAKPTYLTEADRKSTMDLAGAFGLLDGGEPRSLELPEPFGDRPLLEQIESLAWLSGFRGRVDGTHLTSSASNAYMSLPWAKQWESTLRSAVLIIFRQTAGRPQDILMDLVDYFNRVPIPDLRDKIIDQVRLHANEASISHEVNNFWDVAKTAPYTAFHRKSLLRFDQGAKRAAQRTKRSTPKRSSR